MKTYLIAVSGVLRRPVGGAVIPVGIDLYRGLASQGRVVPVLYGESADEIQSWMELHGLVHHPTLCAAGVQAPQELRRDGYDIGMVVVADPNEAMYHITAGFNTMLFTHAQYAMPSWRPDSGRGIKPWAAILDEANHLAEMRAKDHRLREGE